MRFEIFPLAAALKILRKKLWQVSFPAGFPFQFKMAQVVFYSAFYLTLLAALALCAFLVRLLGATPDPEPDPKTKPKPDKPFQPEDTSAKRLSDEDDIQKKKARENLQAENSEPPKTISNASASESEPAGSKIIPELPVVRKPSSVVTPKQSSKSYSLVSPLTLFLVADAQKGSKSVNEPLSNKRLHKRSRESPSKTRKLD